MSSSGDDPYAHVCKGSLKLKNSDGISKKKSKKKEQKKLVEVAKIVDEEQTKPVEIKRTKAELAFLKMQEKMDVPNGLQKDNKSHR
ncbi:Protein of unknown function [Cotesia congregata]|uniref:Uncharacterized protein n=1 Tax=Cotesia congregata TaxID=51543 RepID=A0A8J2HLA9_COTCN|nr:Protein of unknown function [Cotesia congregata]